MPVCVLKRPGAKGHHCQCSDMTACDSAKTLQRNHIHHFLSCRCYSMTGSATGSCKDAKSTDQFSYSRLIFLDFVHLGFVKHTDHHNV